MGGIQLVVTDLDGTLWPGGTDEHPHPAAIDAWNELDRRGIPVVVATGRRVTGARACCDAFGVDPGRVLAIGDEVNDVELISRAAVGVAMAGGHPDALAAADHIVARERDGGWAELLDLL